MRIDDRGRLRIRPAPESRAAAHREKSMCTMGVSVGVDDIKCRFSATCLVVWNAQEARRYEIVARSNDHASGTNMDWRLLFAWDAGQRFECV